MRYRGWESQREYRVTVDGADKDDAFTVVEKYGVIGFPTTYILDKDLKVHRKFTGKLPGKEELEREIEPLLADR